MLGWGRQREIRIKEDCDFNNQIDLICDKNKMHDHTLAARCN